MRLNGKVEKGWGFENIWVTSDKYCSKFMHFKTGAKFSMHFHAIKEETWYILKGKFIVTWIGRVVPVKAPLRIIEVAKECVQRGLKIHFVLVGEGPLLVELKTLANEMKLPMDFLGWQSDIEKILSFSDLVLLTSENEGTPVALIQAQMAGVPVLTTDVGSASEVVINGISGFCLKYSARDFADKIELIASNFDMESSFGAIGEAHARENFSLNRMICDYAELYRELISQSKF